MFRFILCPCLDICGVLGVIIFVSFVIRSGRCCSIGCVLMIYSVSISYYLSYLLSHSPHQSAIPPTPPHNFPRQHNNLLTSAQNSSPFSPTAYAFKLKLLRKYTQIYFFFPSRIYHKFQHIF